MRREDGSLDFAGRCGHAGRASSRGSSLVLLCGRSDFVWSMYFNVVDAILCGRCTFMRSIRLGEVDE